MFADAMSNFDMHMHKINTNGLVLLYNTSIQYMTNSTDFWREIKKIDQYLNHLATQLIRQSDQKRFRKYFLPSTKPFLTVYPQVILILNGFMLLCMIMLRLIIGLTLILFNDV